jgi:hypothetical protein
MRGKTVKMLRKLWKNDMRNWKQALRIWYSLDHKARGKFCADRRRVGDES